MQDQAQGLRSLASLAQEGVRSRRSQIAHRPARTIAIAGGKGGVGKTCIAVNLAYLLAAAGEETILFDADFGLPNAHLCLGVQPELTLDNLLQEECALHDTLLPVTSHLRLLAGASAITEFRALSRSRQERFAQRFQWLDSLAKNLILDLGAGLSSNVVTFLASVEEVVIVTTPELTAMADAYATLKIAYNQNPQAHYFLVVNHAQDAREAEFVRKRLQSMADQFLGCTLSSLGYVPHDEKVGESVRRQVPFVNAFPHALASRKMEVIANRIRDEEHSFPSQRGAGTLLKEATSAVVYALHLDAKRTRKEQEMETALWKAHSFLRSCPC